MHIIIKKHYCQTFES